MRDYTRVNDAVRRLERHTPEAVFVADVMPALIETWLDQYRQLTRVNDVVSVTVDHFSYLFDLKGERLIAAWGISRGLHEGARDKARMAGHPRTGGDRYHRGHAIAHTLGGTTDINLVAQLGSINVGAFRELERAAVNTPGALYFTHWIFDSPDAEIAARVEQGLLIPGKGARIMEHPNRHR